MSTRSSDRGPEPAAAPRLPWRRLLRVYLLAVLLLGALLLLTVSLYTIESTTSVRVLYVFPD